MKGGWRSGAGRKPNSGRYREPTKAMRVPVSLEEIVRVFIEVLCGLPVPNKALREIRERIEQSVRARQGL